MRAARFRNQDLFRSSRLCERCMEIVSGSRLLRGTRRLIARAEEEHLFCGVGLGEMEGRVSNGCSLCEALLSQLIEDEEETGARLVMVRDGSKSNVRRYGTVSWDGDLERAWLKLRVQFVKRALWPETPANLAMFLETGSLTRFASLRVSEGQSYHLLLGVKELTPSLGPLEPPESEGDAQKHTGSNLVIDTINYWLKNCERHPSCRLQSSFPIFVPTRLIAVGTLNSPSLRLITTLPTSLDASPPVYTALSHCWGGNIPDPLTTHNYSQMQTSLNEPTLPATSATQSTSPAVSASHNSGSIRSAYCRTRPPTGLPSRPPWARCMPMRSAS